MMLSTKHDISSTTSANNNIITTSELGYYTDIPDSLSASVDFWIKVVSSKIDSEVNHVFAPNEWIGIYDYKFNRSADTSFQYLYTDNLPITSISSVQYRYSPISPWVNYDVSQLEYHQNKVLFYYPTLLYSDFPKNVKIIYTAGNIPDEVKEIAIELVVELYQESGKGQSRLGINSSTQSNPSGSHTTTFKDLSERHKKILANYKKTR